MAEAKRGRVLFEDEIEHPIQFAAMTFLHRELTAKGEVVLTQHDFLTYQKAVADGKSGIQLGTNDREDVIMTPVKARSDG